jgi:hypothetical protein
MGKPPEKEGTVASDVRVVVVGDGRHGPPRCATGTP